MKTLSITKSIIEFKKQDKTYLVTYQNNGYELGFGKRGCYKGHSHYFFYDILFSPDKLVVKNSTALDSFLLVVPPRTFMDDIEIGDFFFIKFCPSNDSFSLPDKTDMVLKEGEIKMYSSASKLSFPWFKTPSKKFKINIDAEPNNLTITLGNEEILKIIQ